MARIEQNINFSDGRSLIKTLGIKRLKIIKYWESKDGYNIANIEYLDDNEMDLSFLEDINNLREKFMNIFEDSLEEIEKKYGEIPIDLPFVYFLLDFLPISLSAKQSFLELSSNQETITALKHVFVFIFGEKSSYNY